ncbi:hypothetical protein HI914_05495 [Erysiphe necator]|nr:hypothetical protein HI914_05495 [Erysiphe necator]
MRIDSLSVLLFLPFSLGMEKTQGGFAVEYSKLKFTCPGFHVFQSFSLIDETREACNKLKGLKSIRLNNVQFARNKVGLSQYKGDQFPQSQKAYLAPFKTPDSRGVEYLIAFNFVPQTNVCKMLGVMYYEKNEKKYLKCHASTSGFHTRLGKSFSYSSFKESQGRGSFQSDSSIKSITLR